MKKLVLLAVAFGGAVLVTQPLMAQETIATKPLAQQKTFRVAIDAGHGGQDKGDVVDGVAASDVNLVLALKLKTILEARGVQVVLTRSDNSYSALRPRTDLVEKAGVNCFVALRAIDATKYHSALEVNYQNQRKSALAYDLNASLGNTLKTPIEGPVNRNYFMLREISVPAAMVSGDLAKLQNSQAQDQFVNAVAAGIKQFSTRAQK